MVIPGWRHRAAATPCRAASHRRLTAQDRVYRSEMTDSRVPPATQLRLLVSEPVSTRRTVLVGVDHARIRAHAAAATLAT
jgi:hypothetical protein